VAIKDSTETWVRSKPMLAIVAFAAIGLVVGGVVGLGVGYKVEKNRTQEDVKRLQQQIKASGAANPNAKVVQRVGEITGSSGTTLTVKTKLQGTQNIQTTATTPFEKTADATVADITAGKKVLVATGGHAVIILPATSEIGRNVASVDSDGFSVANSKGKTVKVKNANVQKVYTLTPGKSTDAKVGSDVIIGGRGAGEDAFSAVEVIVLPANSAFNS
jgi:hypothetical protein